MKQKRRMTVVCLMLLICFLVSGAMRSVASGPKAADPVTKEINSRLPQFLNQNDQEENELARRGWIASGPDVVIRGAKNKPVWDMTQYGFLAENEQVPDTVHPALWRHARRNAISGLFKITDGIYQVRGYDISNITFIEGKSGIIVVDPLVSVETARAALELYYRHLPKHPVTAVIYTHSHVDHWGGVKGVVSDADLQSRKVRIIAPEGLTKEMISENALAGNAMKRRATYMYGGLLPRGSREQVDAGIGKAASSGVISYLMPTEDITKPVQEMEIDGVKFVFQSVPGTEAPVEVNFYLPDRKVLCVAENATASLHNLLTPRGALIRDGFAWARSLDDTLDLFGDQADILFTTHLWPRFGKEKIKKYLEKQRDMYKYIHDQTVRLMNQGYTMTECAEKIQLPQSLAGEWFNRNFYGTVNFNVKAVYQRYLGWFDGNPAHLHPLPPEEAGRKYVEFMGGSAAVLTKAKQAMQKGEYRWVAEVVNHVIFAEPENRDARELQADVLEQLGYQAESPIWRNFYLTGARELRQGIDRNAPLQEMSPDIAREIPMGQFFDLMAVRLNPEKAADKTIRVNWVLKDTGEIYTLTLANSVLHYKKISKASNADATITLSRKVFEAIVTNQASFIGRILAGDIQIDGEKMKFLEMMSCVEEFDLWFNIVRP
jgi:alkyl sulfatase BDS1-like metallo-beta-lactamase superfamily hydrolase